MGHSTSSVLGRADSPVTQQITQSALGEAENLIKGQQDEKKTELMQALKSNLKKKRVVPTKWVQHLLYRVEDKDLFYVPGSTGKRYPDVNRKLGVIAVQT